MCEICKVNFEKNQYCDFCFQLYHSTGVDDEMDGHSWLQCENEGCGKWNHGSSEKID